jgi:hypothetical protein
MSSRTVSKKKKKPKKTALSRSHAKAIFDGDTGPSNPANFQSGAKAACASICGASYAALVAAGCTPQEARDFLREMVDGVYAERWP